MAIEDRDYSTELVIMPPVCLDDWLAAFTVAREHLEEHHEATRSVTVRIATDVEVSDKNERALGHVV
jgi:hypothetical protein